jgi:hypothetical protein
MYNVCLSVWEWDESDVQPECSHRLLPVDSCSSSFPPFPNYLFGCFGDWKDCKKDQRRSIMSTFMDDEVGSLLMCESRCSCAEWMTGVSLLLCWAIALTLYDQYATVNGKEESAGAVCQSIHRLPVCTWRIRSTGTTGWVTCNPSLWSFALPSGAAFPLPRDMHEMEMRIDFRERRETVSGGHEETWCLIPASGVHERLVRGVSVRYARRETKSKLSSYSSESGLIQANNRITVIMCQLGSCCWCCSWSAGTAHTCSVPVTITGSEWLCVCLRNWGWEEDIIARSSDSLAGIRSNGMIEAESEWERKHTAKTSA